ncbi:MAG TPA: hypothetical protein VF909_09240 [Roseiflexaceae bacterium]
MQVGLAITVCIAAQAAPKITQSRASDGVYDDIVGAVAISNTYAYVGVGSRLHIVDISNPSNPINIGQTASSVETVSDVVIQGNYAYVGHMALQVPPVAKEGLSIIDVTQPTTPTNVGFYDAPGVTSVAIRGVYAYLGIRDQGLRIVDLTNPMTPTAIGFFSISNYNISEIAVAGNYAYVIAGDLLVIDISDPTKPTEVGRLDLGLYSDIVIRDHYAYVAFADVDLSAVGGLHIIDIADPAHPTRVGQYVVDQFTSRLDVTDHYAYLGNALYGGLLIVDISVPTAPKQAADFVLPHPSSAIAARPGYAYVAGEPGFYVINVSNPSAPTLAGVWYSTLRSRIFFPSMLR